MEKIFKSSDISPKGAKAEASIIGTCFNLVRMITLLGVPGLVKELKAC